MKSFKTLGLAIPLLVAAGACDAQVGEDYTGEIVLNLKGSVELLDDRQAELEPALYFPTDGGRALVRGEVKGVFPSDFEFSVTNVPPANSLNEGIALGRLVLASEKEAEWVPVAQSYNRPFFACDGFDGNEPCQFEEEHCTEDDRCITRSYECEMLQFEIVKEQGKDVLSSMDVEISTALNESLRGNETNCEDSGCLGYDVVCSDEGECYTRFTFAESSDETGIDYAFSTKNVFECRIVEEEGDGELIKTSRVAPTVSNYFVLYVKDDTARDKLLNRPYTAFFEAETGYNLYEKKFPKLEAQIGIYECNLEAKLEAHAEYNSEHGTSYRVGGATPMNPQIEIARRSTAIAEEKCTEPVYWERVDDPEKAPLKIEIGSIPDIGLN